MKINWWMLIAGVLYVGAAITEVIKRNATLAVVYSSYAVASFALSFV